jgi:general secretion pathway protein K
MRRRGRRGFALLAVILGVSVLSTIALAIASATRIELLSAAILRRQAKAELAADAGTAIALARLLKTTATEEFTCSFDSTTLWISIADEGGKVDLNAAPRGLLAALFKSVGDSEEQARRRAEAIADFIDPDDITTSDGGSEAKTYEKAGRPRPRNAPFETIDELDQVLGFETDALPDETMLDRLRPYITIYSRQPGIDIQAAPRALINALSEIAPDYRTVSDRRVFLLRAQAGTPDGGLFVRETIVEINPLMPGGHLILASSPGKTRDEPQNRTEALPCASLI